MNYRIEEKPSFDVLAMTKTFNEATSQQEIPNFWKNFHADGHGAVVSGWFGICHDFTPPEFKYSIADPYKPGAEIPPGFEKFTIPSLTWAVFPCVGPMPTAIQTAWAKIFSEWLPTAEYEMLPDYNLEYYSGPNTQDADYKSEIWIPVRKKG